MYLHTKENALDKDNFEQIWNVCHHYSIVGYTPDYWWVHLIQKYVREGEGDRLSITWDFPYTYRSSLDLKERDFSTMTGCVDVDIKAAQDDKGKFFDVEITIYNGDSFKGYRTERRCVVHIRYNYINDSIAAAMQHAYDNKAVQLLEQLEHQERIARLNSVRLEMLNTAK